MAPKISILIVNWNTAGYLKKCLESIFRNRHGHGVEVIVVDNNSVDDSLAVLESFADVVVVRNTFNYGFSVANNQAFHLSSGEYVMTLNPDATLQDGTLSNLVAVLDDHPDIGIAVPAIQLGDEIELPIGELPLFPKSILWSVFRRRFFEKEHIESIPPDTPLIDADYILGTGYLCRRSALGGNYFFREDSFLFGEEYEICRRVREERYRIVIVRDAKVEHIKSVTFKRDIGRGLMAGKLITAANWKARRDLYGTLPSIASNIFVAFDNAISFLLVSLWVKITKKRESAETYNFGYRVGTIVSLNLLVRGETYFQSLNRKARTYFNNGVEPVFPPKVMGVEN